MVASGSARLRAIRSLWRRADVVGPVNGANRGSVVPVSGYAKLKTLEEVQRPLMRKWIEQAGRVRGWK